MKNTIVFRNGFWFSWSLINIFKHRNFFGKMPVSTVQMLRDKKWTLEVMKKTVSEVIFL